MPRTVLPARIFLAGAIVATLATAHAADGTWNVDANSSWSVADPSPWLNGTVADGADFTADFSTINLTADRTITLASSLTIGNMVFEDDTNASHNWTLTGSGVLTLETTTGTPTINVINRTVRINNVLGGDDGLIKSGSGTLILAGNNTYTGTTTINGGILQIGADSTTGSVTGDIVNNGVLRIQRGNSITVGGNITGAGSVAKSNSGGTLILTGDNTYSGGTTLNDGALLLGSGANNGIGTGTLTIGRGRFGSSDNNSRTINNTLSLNISGNLTFGAGQGAADGLGDLVFTDATTGAGPGGSTSITVNNSTTVTLNKRFSGGSGNQITKAGTGTLVLAGASTYAGDTTINGGTLLVNNTSGSATGTGTVNVTAAGTLGGMGIIAPAGNRGISVNGTIAPGAGIGTLGIDLSGTTGTISMLGGAGFKFELGIGGSSIATPGISDRLSITGASESDFTFAGNAIDFLGSGSEGWYKIIDTDLTSGSTWSGLSFSGSQIVGGLTVTNLGVGLSGQLLIGDGTNGDSGDIYLQVVPEPSTGMILLGGLGALLGSLRRNRRGA